MSYSEVAEEKVTFGEFFRAKRESLGFSLRKFCQQHDLDPGNISRMERGAFPPPRFQTRLEEFARFLSIQPGTEDWLKFFELAALARGLMPSLVATMPEDAARREGLFRRVKRMPLIMAVLISAGLLAWGVWVISRGITPDLAAFAITKSVLFQELDKEGTPVGITSEFPEGSKKVNYQFAWVGAPRKLKIEGRWYYADEGILILNFPSILKQTSGSAILSLEMPLGRTFPPGSYRLDLGVKGKVIKTVPFKVVAPVPRARQEVR